MKAKALLPCIGLIALVLSVSMAPMAAAVRDRDEGIPQEWFGKRKVVTQIGRYTRVVLIHYDSSVDVGDPDSDGSADGYALMGVRWNLAKYPSGVPYIVNPSGAVKNYGLSAASVVSEIKSSLESWDLALDYDDYTPPDVVAYNVELYNNAVTVSYTAKASTRRPDYRNVITWGLAQAGVVAYASIWYVSTTGEIVDADIVLNTYYRWGIADGNESTSDLVGKFDIRNIVTHEGGHWTGLDDLYDSKYSAMTMYGYASLGEEIKRSLEPGDIAGAQDVYRA